MTATLKSEQITIAESDLQQIIDDYGALTLHLMNRMPADLREAYTECYRGLSTHQAARVRWAGFVETLIAWVDQNKNTDGRAACPICGDLGKQAIGYSVPVGFRRHNGDCEVLAALRTMMHHIVCQRQGRPPIQPWADPA